MTASSLGRVFLSPPPLSHKVSRTPPSGTSHYSFSALGLLTAILLGFTGCNLTLRAGELAPISNWPPETIEHKAPICVVVERVKFVNGMIRPGDDTLIETVEKEVMKAFNESLLFSDVHRGLMSQVRCAEVFLAVRSETDTFWVIAHFLTIGVLPFKTTQEVSLQLTVKREDLSAVGAVQKVGVQSVREGWIILLALPFRIFFHSPDLIYDLTRSAIIDAHVQGWL